MLTKMAVKLPTLIKKKKLILLFHLFKEFSILFFFSFFKEIHNSICQKKMKFICELS
jgi:hypothetical protein